MKNNRKMKRTITAILLLCAALMPSFGQNIVYTDGTSLPLYGKCIEETNTRYSRLPAEFKDVSRDAVWWLGQMSAGLYLRFRSDAPEIHVKWTSSGKRSMNHMTDTGTRGIDLYAWKDGGWRFAGSGRPATESAVTESKVVANMDPEMREYMLYLSLYDGVDEIAVGVPEGYVVEQPAEHVQSRDGAILMYGTSIMQGCSASRPGMCYTAIIGRATGREVINLGFSGNGRLDYEIAELMARVENPAVYVLDNVPNCSVKEINDRTDRFIDILREKHPDVPIIMLEDPQFGHSTFDNFIRKEVEDKNIAQKAAFKRQKERGIRNVYYITSDKLVAPDGESFVDGIHYTDQGMVHHANALLPVIRKTLRKN